MAKRKPMAPKQPSRVATSAGPSISAAKVIEGGAAIENGAANASASTPQVASHEDAHEQTSHSSPSPAPHGARGLDVFLIDSGWNTPVGAAVHENIPTLAAYLKSQRFFVLNQEQSLSYIQSHPALAGSDPILLVLDRHAITQKNTAGCGFRLCLGHVKQPEVAVSMLKWAVQLTLTVDAVEMAKVVKETGHRNTIQGVIELMGEGSAHLLEFAPI